jgi:hypothetical protein
VTVTKKVRFEAPAVALNLRGGEFLQYLVTSSASESRFSLTDAITKEIILSDQVPPTLLTPATYMRLWPVGGDRSQQESLLILAMSFETAGNGYTFQVQHRQANGQWRVAIDVDFECSAGGEKYLYSFAVITE